MDWRKALIILITICIFACALPALLRSTRILDFWQSPTWSPAEALPLPEPSMQPAYLDPPTRIPGVPISSPTPEPPRAIPTMRLNAENYTVQQNDSLIAIARRYGVFVDQILQINQIENPSTIFPGQVIVIPPSPPQIPGPDFKIIPDSELVYGPATINFSPIEIINKYNGYLKHYQEEVDGETWRSADIIARISQEYSVNPRLLLALLEYRSSWLTNPHPSSDFDYYPLGYYNEAYSGLFRQLSWAADNFNRGYYLWKAGNINTWTFSDYSGVIIAPTINAGTAGVQHVMSLLYNKENWLTAVSEQGLFLIYSKLFGYPFDYAVEPLVGTNIPQPVYQLPFDSETTWSFTGAPHGGWGSGSAWAALDFAPPGEPQGCVVSPAWTSAIADGLVIRSERGVVIQDLDLDGFEQTGWTILYLHIAAEDRVPTGTYLRAGDHIGHPSCEGGVSNSSHLHIARRYNGEWIPAAEFYPFILDGWIPVSQGTEYDGFLHKNDQIIEAWDSYKPENQISR